MWNAIQSKKYINILISPLIETYEKLEKIDLFDREMTIQITQNYATNNKNNLFFSTLIISKWVGQTQN